MKRKTNPSLPEIEATIADWADALRRGEKMPKGKV